MYFVRLRALTHVFVNGAISALRRVIIHIWIGTLARTAPGTQHRSGRSKVSCDNCSCNGRHSCELRNCWTTPPSLIALLQKHFSLEVEGMGDVLHHSCHLQEWYSRYQEDQVFGAKHDFFKQDLSGKNTYINPPFNTFEDNQNLIEKVVSKISDSCDRISQ